MYRIHDGIRSEALKDLQALFSFLYPQLQYTEKDSASLEQCLIINTYKGKTMNIIVALFIAVAFVYGLYQLTIGDDDE